MKWNHIPNGITYVIECIPKIFKNLNNINKFNLIEKQTIALFFVYQCQNYMSD